MTWKNLILVPFLALTPVIVGCGADCEDVCEKANECPGEDDDCGEVCSEAESLNEKAGCEDSFDDYISCIDDEDDICIDEETTDLSKIPCSSEAVAYGTCVQKYCSSHASEAACM
jgi:hypothetical protein